MASLGTSGESVGFGSGALILNISSCPPESDVVSSVGSSGPVTTACAIVGVETNLFNSVLNSKSSRTSLNKGSSRS